jgi:hypothetical protein
MTWYEPRMGVYEERDDGVMIEKVPHRPSSFQLPPGTPFCLILVTHDESTFYLNDQRKTFWQHEGAKAVPPPKGEGASIMVSDFLTAEWGRLTSSDGQE